MAPAAPPVPLPAVESLLRTYAPYLKTHANFDRTNTVRDAPDLECPRLEGPTLERLIAFALELPTGVGEGAEQDLDLVLSVAGQEGEYYDLSSSDSPRRVDASDAEAAKVGALCSTATFESLLGGRLTVEEAVYSGLLLLEGDPGGVERATDRIQAYLERERRDAVPAASGGVA